MPTTDRSADTVASLLVTIYRNQGGDFSTSVEAMPPDRDSTRDGTARADSFEWLVEPETFATTARQQPGATRWRWWLIAAVLAVLVGGAIALRPSRSSHPLSSPAATVATASANASPPASGRCAGAGGAECSGPTEILPGLDAACSDLLVTAAHAVGEDPQQWTRTVVVSMVRSGDPLSNVIRKWLTSTRADVLATRYTDPQLEMVLNDIESAIAVADTGACSPHG
jgi:hypothetical protein